VLALETGRLPQLDARLDAVAAAGPSQVHLRPSLGFSSCTPQKENAAVNAPASRHEAAAAARPSQMLLH